MVASVGSESVRVDLSPHTLSHTVKLDLNGHIWQYTLGSIGQPPTEGSSDIITSRNHDLGASSRDLPPTCRLAVKTRKLAQRDP